MNRLVSFNEQYEHIMHSLEGAQRDKALATLMTELEHAYQIPAIQNARWEKEHKPVIALYRKVSLSRSFMKDEEES